MKTFDISNIQESIQQLRSTTSELIDQGYNKIASYLVFPQSLAGYTGLKKLIEKDYSDDVDHIIGSLVSS